MSPHASPKSGAAAISRALASRSDPQAYLVDDDFPALTGARLDGAECLWAGIATHYVPSEMLAEAKARIIDKPGRMRFAYAPRPKEGAPRPDRDHDGFFDEEDECPEVAAGPRRDAKRRDGISCQVE